jgi:hypothetical protein
MTGDGSIAGIIGPELAADLIATSLNAVVPRGGCLIDAVQPCLQALPSVIVAGAGALGVKTVCQMTPPDGT